MERLSAVQFCSEPFEIGRRAGAQIDDNIPKGALDRSHHLHFGRGRQLVVQAAQRSFGRGQRIVDLHEARLKTRGGELVLAEEPGEEAAIVAALLQFDQIRALERRFVEFHCSIPQAWESWEPAQIRSEPARRHVTLERFEPYVWRVAEILVGEPHGGQPVTQTRDRLFERYFRNVVRRQRPEQGKVHPIGTLVRRRVRC